MPKALGSGRFPCRVQFYAGSRADETPRRVVFAGRDLAVEKVLGRKRIQDKATGKVGEEFTIVLEGQTARLRQARSGRWSLLLPGHR